jgi:hypothetical protein
MFTLSRKTQRNVSLNLRRRAVVVHYIAINFHRENIFRTPRGPEFEHVRLFVSQTSSKRYRGRCITTDVRIHLSYFLFFWFYECFAVRHKTERARYYIIIYTRY